jgi:hypothetical protein
MQRVYQLKIHVFWEIMTRWNYLDSEDGGSNLFNFLFIILCHISEELNFHQHFVRNSKSVYSWVVECKHYSRHVFDIATLFFTRNSLKYTTRCCFLFVSIKFLFILLISQEDVVTSQPTVLFFFLWHNSPNRAWAGLLLMSLDHTQL